MVKPGTETSKRLMNLLYSQTASNLALKELTPGITKHLYSEISDNSPNLLHEDLTSEIFDFSKLRKLPAQEAVSKCSPKFESNILSFKCPNSFITKKDFQNLLPKERYLNYNLNPINNFEVLKRRDDKLLTFQNEYYLIFKNQLNACVYKLETSNKLINGIPMNLTFQPIDIVTKQLVPPILQQPNHAQLVEQILHSSTNLQGSSSSSFLNYDLLMNMIDLNRRRKTVLVHNWPFGVKRTITNTYFRNYGLNPIEPRTVVESDISKEISIVLINFLKERCATRFIRNFHGKSWHILQDFSRTNEKVFYQPLLCESL